MLLISAALKAGIVKQQISKAAVLKRTAREKEEGIVQS
jgi:hypothetical protein